MDVTDYFVMLVGFAVIAIVVYGGYHRSVQNRKQDDPVTTTKHAASHVPAE